MATVSRSQPPWTRRDVLAVFAWGLLAALGWLMVPVWGVGLLLLVPAYLGTQRTLALHGRVERLPSMLPMPWLIATLACLGLGAASLLGAALAERLPPEGRWLASSLSCLFSAGLFGAVTAPVLTLPLVLMHPRPPLGLRRALAASSAAVASAPLGGLSMGAAHAILFISPALLAVLCSSYGMLALGGLTTPLLAGLVARSHRRELAQRTTSSSTEVGAPSLRLPLGLASQAALLAVAALVVVALVPSSARHRVCPDDATFVSLPAPLPGTDLTLSPRRDGVLVEAPGGRVGLIQTPDQVPIDASGWTDDASARLRRGVPASIYLRGASRCYVTCLDARGARCDDSIYARVSAHVGWPQGLVLLCALFFGLRFLWRNVSDLRLRSQLAALRTLGDATGLRALSGTLRWGEGASLQPLGGAGRLLSRVWIEGDVKLDAGDFVVRLPAGSVPFVDPDPERLRDGAPVTLVGDFAQLVAGGFREASIELPKRHLLVPGALPEAEARLLAKTTREARWSLLGAGLSLVLLAVLLMAS
ncbi:MAG: hypothetical protein GXP55_22525 [Deltaproteobacteria bacterium]|nr:hypothetical protein [Deltaproteobacteria bacterium]